MRYVCTITYVLHLLVEYDVNPDILSLISSFLQERMICMIAGGHDYYLGVLQRSCLGPILWLVLINSLLERLVSDEVT